MNLMRQGFLWASTNPWLSSQLPRRRFVRRAVRRFMPGETLEDALRECATLQQRGVTTLITILGENVESGEETQAIVEAYSAGIRLAEDRDLDVQLSIKPTQLGMDLDVDLAYKNVSLLAARSAKQGTLWIDMEGTAYAEPTLELYRALQQEHANVGVCLQSYLRRTAADIEALLPLGPRIRLVKGAYAEPAELAFPDKRDVDKNYLTLGARLIAHLGGGGAGFLGLGTHDPAMTAPLVRQATQAQLTRENFEIAMLYGIGVREQERLVREGAPLRVLISYGSAWFPWYMRRLAERPANVWFVVRSLLR